MELPLGQKNLWHVLRTLYFPSRFRIRSDLTRRQYVFAVRELEDMLLRPPTIDDLVDDTFVELVRFMEAQKLQSRTINDRVGRLKTLANWCWRKGLIRFGPTIEKIPEPIRIPRAWNKQQLAALFDAARKMPGYVGPYRACVWWSAFLALAWWTGERTTALLSLEWRWLEQDVLYVPGEVRKGGRKDAAYRLPVECLSLLMSIAGNHAKIFHRPARQGRGRRKADGDSCIQTFYRDYDALLRLAGLPTGRHNKVQKIRRSHATWKEIMGGNASRSLMHDDPATTHRYYIDPGMSEEDRPLFSPWGDDSRPGREPIDRQRPPGA